MTFERMVLNQVDEVHDKVPLKVKPVMVVPCKTIDDFDLHTERFHQFFENDGFSLSEIGALAGQVEFTKWNPGILQWIVYFNGGFFGVNTPIYTEHFVRYTYLHELGHIHHDEDPKRVNDEHNADVFAIRRLNRYWPRHCEQTKQIMALRNLEDLFYHSRG